MPEPTFHMDEDGCHVWWFHDCMTYLGEGDTEGMREDERGNKMYPYRAKTYLPVNKDSGWQITQVEPLTVTPSILCGRCKTHGFITNGVWVGV